MNVLHVENLTTEDVHTICQNYCSRTKLRSVASVNIIAYEIARMSEEPTGFLSQQGVLKVKCSINNVPENITFFVKLLPITSVKQLEYIENFGAFKKEIKVYRNILPKLKILTTFNYAPHCYLLKNYNLIVFEDLASVGFTMSPTQTGELDLQHMIVALDAVAALHASSIIYEKEHDGQQITDMFAGDLNENAYPSTDECSATARRVWVTNATFTLCALLKELPQYHFQLTDILNQFTQTINLIYDFCKTSTTFRNVFSHGDLWSNNIMFRYAHFSNGIHLMNDMVPIEAKLVDFQLARYSPPAFDVMTLISLTSNSDFRKQHLSKLLDSYYFHLGNELIKHNIDVNVELIREEFDESCKYYRLAGLIESSLYSHLTLLPKNIAAKIVDTSEHFDNFLSRLDICMEAFKTDSNYRFRMLNTIQEIVDVYVLPKI